MTKDYYTGLGSLLPGETHDLKNEIKKTLGDEWLYQKNVLLAGKSPNELMGTHDEFKVRDIFRSIMVSSFS